MVILGIVCVFLNFIKQPLDAWCRLVGTCQVAPAWEHVASVPGTLCLQAELALGCSALIPWLGLLHLGLTHGSCGFWNEARSPDSGLTRVVSQSSSNSSTACSLPQQSAGQVTAALCSCWPLCPEHGFLDTLLSTPASGPECLLDTRCFLRMLWPCLWFWRWAGGPEPVQVRLCGLTEGRGHGWLVFWNLSMSVVLG